MAVGFKVTSLVNYPRKQVFLLCKCIHGEFEN